ncbi:MAG: NAD(P)H-dependent glycerol-3-phosphate dehydrogenase [Candidatus Caenarcaniphilales bacterium]|nr:NAD(P)H-dependent glycerol-3-phosphate dehydrogenase [Candidatus Caenarcaniphilales bacterium]
MHSSKTITVLGAGSWGTVLAHMLCSSGHQIKLWTRSKRFVEHVKQTGRFTRPIELSLPESIFLTDNLNLAIKDSEILLCALPSEAIPETIQKLKELELKPKKILSTTKGLEQSTSKRISQLWKENFDCEVAVLSGPNLSAEAALAKPMRTIIASNNLEFTQQMGKLFQVRHLKIETSADVIGTEIAGATKNVIALVAGAWDGLDLGTSGKGAMLTRAMNEIAALVELMGGQRQSAYSVAGIGDMYITCSSSLSRNYRAGFMLGKGKALQEINQELKGQVAEGFWTTPLIHDLAIKYKADFKVCEAAKTMIELDLSSKEGKYRLEELLTELV